MIELTEYDDIVEKIRIVVVVCNDKSTTNYSAHNWWMFGAGIVKNLYKKGNCSLLFKLRNGSEEFFDFLNHEKNNKGLCSPNKKSG